MQRRQFLSAFATWGALSGVSLAGSPLDALAQRTPDVIFVPTDFQVVIDLKLRPKLLKELKPGTRIVSHAFGMGDWKPETTGQIGTSSIYLWRIPPRA